MASTNIHLTTLVSNIKNCIPIQLDEKGVHYNTWSISFQVHCSAHLVLDHIIPDESSNEIETKNSEWKHLDDIVRTWIYSIICPVLLISIVQPKDSARDVWGRLEKTFYNNKTTRTLHLEAQFNDLSILPNSPMSKAIAMNSRKMPPPSIFLALPSPITDWLFKSSKD